MWFRFSIVGAVCGIARKCAYLEKRDKAKDKDKLVKDPVHGHIRINPVCMKIIDTPQFQRLRHLKQMGATYLVYPGAAHNRFEHSIGVYHLAGEFARSLQRNQPELDITPKDILCVEIAGLCHDLGHGPFSHTFDGKFIPRTRKEGEPKWTHEEGSLKMLEYLINNNEKVKKEFVKRGLEESDLEFIKQLINGPGKKKVPEDRKDKLFLYEIVSNKRSGIDVDKWDYFARDCHMLGLRNSFDHKRYMELAKVIDVEKEGKQICIRDTEASNVYNMFHTRAMLYKHAALHKVTTGIEEMFVDALVKANDHIRIPGKDRETKKMSQCIDDMEAYSKLDDSIIGTIRLSTDTNLKEAQEILRKIATREIYKCIGKTIQTVGPGKKIDKTDEDMIKKEIMQSFPEVGNLSDDKLKEEDFFVDLKIFNYGMKDKDPIQSVRFYSKSKPDEAFLMMKEEVSHMLPEQFEDRVLTVYSKDRNKDELIKKCFERWYAKKNRANMGPPQMFL